jgi:hypothetical protein
MGELPEIIRWLVNRQRAVVRRSEIWMLCGSEWAPA